MRRRGLDRLYLFFAACYLAQGMSGIIYEPLSYVLKDRLGLGPADSAVFIWWMTLPLLVKPLFGLASDLLPLGARRRRPHLILSCVLWTGALVALAALRGFSYGSLLALTLLVNVGLVLSDVVCDAIMVEQGREEGKTGPYQAVQIGVLYGTIVVTGLGGGWLAAHAPARAVFALAAVFPALALLSAVWAREPQAPPPSAGARSFGRFLASRRFWLVSALIFLWSFSPFLGTAQFYYQVDALKLSPLAIGGLDTIGGLSGALGAVLYGRFIGVWSLRRWLSASVWGGAALGLLYLFYLGPLTAAAVTAVTGLLGVGFRLALMDLAARSCPAGAEAAEFAAYMAVFNLAASSSNWTGARLFEALRPALSPYGDAAVLVVLGAACTAACWPLLPPVLAFLEEAKERSAALPNSASYSSSSTGRR